MPRPRVIVVRVPDAAGCRAFVRASLAVARGVLAEGGHPRAAVGFPLFRLTGLLIKAIGDTSIRSLPHANSTITMSNPVCFFDMSIGGQPAGRIEMTVSAHSNHSASRAPRRRPGSDRIVEKNIGRSRSDARI